VLSLKTSKITDHLVAARHRGAEDEAVGVTNPAHNLNFQVASYETTNLPAQPAADRNRQVTLHVSVIGTAAGHCDRPEAVEFITQGLRFLPIEELQERHGFAERTGHDAHCNTTRCPERGLRAAPAVTFWDGVLRHLVGISAVPRFRLPSLTHHLDSASDPTSTHATHAASHKENFAIAL
jgi:hypothetical protein